MISVKDGAIPSEVAPLMSIGFDNGVEFLPLNNRPLVMDTERLGEVRNHRYNPAARVAGGRHEPACPVFQGWDPEGEPLTKPDAQLEMSSWRGVNATTKCCWGQQFS